MLIGCGDAEGLKEVEKNKERERKRERGKKEREIVCLLSVYLSLCLTAVKQLFEVREV